ncbi:hypothetical protein [Staphylococcus massiliensis]|uniref:hypothetical protein n=1 Tax=Staphylococcus massiliensis TaxID=555791 RepID=UPI0003031FC3|nr:hypothetical protein [Staphylococcus massiliensis]MCG3398932.1 hypothetical protein [Staphylococcus massiliensis]MCG3401066.1 hypothetical protein [Staphylococcus massiliensis]MCG3413476.1 hypothetical protein [Staphylococcus massiliensis]
MNTTFLTMLIVVISVLISFYVTKGFFKSNKRFWLQVLVAGLLGGLLTLVLYMLFIPPQ